MKKNLSMGSILALIVLMSVLSSCNRIDAGHVGIKANTFGDDKGTSQAIEVYGMNFYNPLTSSIYEYQTYVRHKQYDSAIKVQCKGGAEFTFKPVLNYQLKADHVLPLFKKFRKELEVIEDEYLKTCIQEAYRIVANNYTADSLISSRSDFDNKIKVALEKQLNPDGFEIVTFTSSIEYPDAIKKSIELKNIAIQSSITAENKIREARAIANADIEKANGKATAMRLEADAVEYSNEHKSRNLTPQLLNLYWIDAWKFGGSNVPYYMGGSGTDKFFFTPQNGK